MSLQTNSIEQFKKQGKALWHPSKSERSIGTSINNMKLLKNVQALMSKEILPKGSMVKLLRDHNVILLLFQKYGYRMVHAIFPSEVNHASRLKTMYSFARYLHQMYLHHGPVYVVQYLKVGQLAIQKAIAGTPLSSMKEVSLFPFPRLTGDGLPVFINSVDRGLIRSSHPSVIRYWLTLFSVYRVITLPGVLKLNTITDSPGFDKDKMQDIVDLISMKWDPSMLDMNILRQEPDLLLLESASAGSKVSCFDYSATAFFLSRTSLFESFNKYAQLLGYSSILTNIKLVLQDDRLAHMWFNRIDMGRDMFGLAFGRLGKLSAKDEPAGKVRIFAMIDPWTQSILKPLHNVIFQLLENLPNDAMRDQQASVQRCMEKANAAGLSYGYDLSAATDRLPLAFQAKILNLVLPNLGDLWGELMVNRDFDFNHKLYAKEGITVRYATGQPMGAYSSWGMLDLVHHLIVQVAAHRAGVISGLISKRNWYLNYEMLGDDVVIFNTEVATQYLEIMSTLGVPINLTKSVIAKNATFEFAKVTGHKGHFVSALSWKSFMSQDTMMGRANICFALLQKGFIHKKIMTWILNVTRYSQYNPGNPNPTLVALMTMVSNSGIISFETVLKLLVSTREPFKRWYDSILLNVNTDLFRHILPALLQKKGDVVIPIDSKREQLWSHDKVWAMLSLMKPLELFKHKVLNNRRAIALQLAKELVQGNNSFWDYSVMEFITLDNIEFPDNEWTFHQEQTWSLVYMWFRILLAKLDKHSAFIESLQGNWVNPSFQDLLDMTEEMDRFNEVETLNDRIRLKMAGSAAQKERFDSPLHALKAFQKMNNKRPDWTRAVIS